MPPRDTRPSDVQALLDTVRASTAYHDFDEKPPTSHNGHDPAATMAALLDQVHGQFKEVSQGRDALAQAHREMEIELTKLAAEVTSLRTERDHLARLKGLYERKFSSIRELAQQ